MQGLPGRKLISDGKFSGTGLWPVEKPANMTNDFLTGWKPVPLKRLEMDCSIFPRQPYKFSYSQDILFT